MTLVFRVDLSVQLHIFLHDVQAYFKEDTHSERQLSSQPSDKSVYLRLVWI